ncbi:TPA: hypothetical protein JLJ21_003773 [Escherichia coli]|nr:hypothetical protein [Escherichia coli]HAW0381162.1 hypothetical protein [Escherichia coli]
MWHKRSRAWQISMMVSLVFGLLTYLTNLYFKIKEDKRKAARGE